VYSNSGHPKLEAINADVQAEEELEPKTWKADLKGKPTEEHPKQTVRQGNIYANMCKYRQDSQGM
jgi:hypothetical protein